MANFLVVVDPDVERRGRFIEAVEPLLPPVEGLISGRCSTDDFCAVWAAGRHAPVSQWADTSGAAVIWGDAIAGPGPRRMRAAELMPLWTRCGGPAATYDGFHAAVVYRRGAGIILGADLLGMFPVYYYTIGDVLLAGSSPELFRHHEAFREEFNPAGLVGMLLTMHIVDGQTLMRGVRRLAAGHRLLWRDEQDTTESEQFRIPVTTEYSERPLFAQVDMLEQVLDDVITRHVPAGGQHGLLLSGGLDSRMLGGLVKRQGAGDVVAFTIGLPSDIEMKCAIPVASALGFRHRVVNIPYEQYPACADLQAKWEHGVNGFNFPTCWGLYPHLSGVVQRVIMGHAMDTILSEPICSSYLGGPVKISFESFFAYQNRWGLHPDVLRKLLRGEIFGELVAETIDGIRRTYENYAELDFHRARCFDLHHRARFHVGHEAWAISFGAWPVVPALDRGLLELAGAMSLPALWERVAQRELLCTRFPRLAALPVDRNSSNTTPLQPRLRQRLASRLRGSLRKYVAPFAPWRHRGGDRAEERRYYYRVCDMNGPGWRAIRTEAEQHRERVLEVFNKEALDAVLPVPDVPLQLKDGIIDSSGLKSLLGFMLWSRDHSVTLRTLMISEAFDVQAMLLSPMFS